MDVTIGQQVRVPDPDGDGLLLATVVEIGEKADGVEVEDKYGKRKRDVVIVRYCEGVLEGTTRRYRYDELKPPQ